MLLREQNGKITLATKLEAAQRRNNLSARLLIAPLLVFLLVVFIYPVFALLISAVEDSSVSTAFPRTLDALSAWNREAPPEEETYAALHADLSSAELEAVVAAANRLNEDQTGLRDLVMRTARNLRVISVPPYKSQFLDADPRWGTVETWRIIRTASGPMTTKYLLGVLDLKLSDDGVLEKAPPEKSVYLKYLTRTLEISLTVVLICLVIGYPLAMVITGAGPTLRRLLLLLVLLPFWTSLLVRTTAWLIILRTDGLANQFLTSVGVTAGPLPLIFNRLAVLVVLCHIMLPFLVLPLYSVMTGIPKNLMKAAASLGARPLAAFLTVYLPLSLPGVGAGCILVFVLTLGFYITPALVGGPRDQMLSYLIAEFVIKLGNWSMASATATLLLIAVAIIVPVLIWITSLGRDITR